MIEIGALWKKQTKDGDTYLRGTLNQNTDILILANKYKKAENQPDYKVFFVERNKEARKPAQPKPKPLPSFEEVTGKPFPNQAEMFESNEDDVDQGRF